jgi:hypothetical protein
MRKIIALAGFFVLDAAQAGVYKCTDPGGKIIYQSTECTTGSAEQVNIKQFDADRIAEAQSKLSESLKEDAERETAAAEAAQKESELEARQELADQVRNQTDALNRNAEALESRNRVPPPVYYAPATVVPAPATASPTPAPAVSTPAPASTSK